LRGPAVVNPSDFTARVTNFPPLGNFVTHAGHQHAIAYVGKKDLTKVAKGARFVSHADPAARCGLTLSLGDSNRRGAPARAIALRAAIHHAPPAKQAAAQSN
jgi:hypothetical protein